ncbi:MAG: DUF4405 domain-containing protein [Phyllobacterium sp.]|uniref:DUF4405 domain-containing protein n=1 Tax=Phyllobacterium sp. TaxID=1871046 RepID=UPI0030F05B36
MFLLVIVHNVFNRRWYSSIAKSQRGPRGLFNTGVTFLLLFAMLALLVTSVLISNALSGIMAAYGGFTVRQIHTLAGYWLLIIVAVHLGLRWPLIMSVARSLPGITKPNTARSLALRVIAAMTAAYGIWSSFRLGIGTKLSMQMTLDWWNFDESVVGFFIHALAIAGLYTVITHYTIRLLQLRRKSSTPFQAGEQIVPLRQD